MELFHCSILGCFGESSYTSGNQEDYVGDVDDRESKWRANDLCMQEPVCCVTVDLVCQHHQVAAISKK